LHVDFGIEGRKLSNRNRTIHDMLEGSHCLVVCYVGNEACVLVKQVCFLLRKWLKSPVKAVVSTLEEPDSY
jgi:hypothetical protein